MFFSTIQVSKAEVLKVTLVTTKSVMMHVFP